MNNKADLPVTMLVIGVFAVCTLALISFYYVNINISNSFVGLNLIEEVSADIEKINFQHAEIKEIYIQIEKGTNKRMIYRGIKIPAAYWGWRKEKLLFEVKYYLN